MLREIWESFPEEAASELGTEGSEAPFQGDKLAVRHRRLEVTLTESALCTTAWRREQRWYTEAGTSSPGWLPYWMHRGGQGGMRREKSAGADYQNPFVSSKECESYTEAAI